MEFAVRFVRDLSWAINSPSLLGISAPLSQSDNASIAAWQLKPGDIDQEHLSHYLTSAPPLRTGRYFERLILYWLQYIRGCEIVAHSLQVRDGKRTVGEIDLLFRDEHRRLTHWEIAVKFYLQADVGDPPVTEYIGPNANDTLQRKTKRLVEHQLPLSSRYFPDVERRQAFVKGRIFYHWQSEATKTPSLLLAADHLQGQWMRKSEVPSFLTTNRLHCRVLKKPFWLAEEIAGRPDDDLLSTDDMIRFIETHFTSRRTPVLISGFLEGQLQQHEFQRVFIVPDHWPS